MKQVKHPTFGKAPVSVGRHDEWHMRERPEASRLALKIGKGIFSGDTLWEFPTREDMQRHVAKHDTGIMGGARWVPVVR